MVDDDVVDVLLAQHAEIEELFATVISSGGETRREAFEKLVRLLTVHEAAEERAVHPLAKASIDSGDEVVVARLAEEEAAKAQLARLRDKGVDDPEFGRGIVALRDAVLTHATYEERYEFPQLRQQVPADRLRAAATEVRSAEARVPAPPADRGLAAS
jgi:hemerythrin superfamily protein